MLALSSVAVGAVMLSTMAGVVPQRRDNLNATLAGAGDTGDVAEALEARITPGESVLGFEGDGTEFLFAYDRIPVFTDGDLANELGNLSDPDVAAAFSSRNIGYVAMGTTSLHWGPKLGYSIARLLEQPQLRLVIQGSDMVVFRYEGVS